MGADVGMAVDAVGDTEGGATVTVDGNEAGETSGWVHDPSSAGDRSPDCGRRAEEVVCGPAVAGRATGAMVGLVDEAAGVSGLVEFMVK